MPFAPQELLARYERLRSARGTWESHWEEIAELVSPRKLGFTGPRPPGDKRMTRVFDPVAIRANELLAAGLHGMATNPASKWFALRMAESALNDDEAVKLYLAEVEQRMFAAMTAPGSGLTNHLHELYLDLGAFGTAVLFIGMTGDSRLVFQARPLAECVIDENADGTVDTVFRRFRYTVRRAVQVFGAAVSMKVREAHERGRLDEPVEILHAVFPRREHGRRQVRETLPVGSVYLECESGQVLSEGGFEEFPYAVPRWYCQAGEVYGRSPAMTALPDVKMLQEMAKTTIKAAQKAVDPPLLVPDDGVIGPVRTVPGGLNYYRGQREIKALRTEADIALSERLMEGVRGRILAAFFADQLQFPREARMTATEVVQRTQERLRLLGPILGRMEAELLGPLVTRVYGLMTRVPGLLPLAPPEIAGRAFTVEYVSPLARAQRQTEADGLVQVLDIALPLAQAAPQILDRLDADRVLPWLSDRFGLDPALTLADDELALLRQNRALMALAGSGGGT